MKDKQAKYPQLRFKGFTDPWVQRNLSDLATFSKGKGYSKSDLVSDGFPAILYGRMYTNYESQIDDISDTFVADATDAVLSQTGDVIVPGSGETPEDIARASNVNVSGIVLGGDINIIRPDTEKMDSTFLALSISNGQQQTELIKRAQGKSVVHLHNSDLKKVNVVAPSKDEQSAISSLFTQLDNLIAANQRKLDLLKEQKKGYLQKMFPKNGAKVPELRFAGFADAWEERKLGQYTKLITKGTTPKDKTGIGDVNFVKVENITNGKIYPINKIKQNEHDNYLKRSRLEEKDILFSIAGTLGRTAIVNKSILPANTNQALAIIRGYDFDTNFLITSLAGNVVKEYIRRNPTVGAQPNLSLEQVGNLLVNTPNAEEQQKIGSFFKQLDDTIALHQRKLDLLKEQKKGFLQNMFV
ncbi:restriction endonuclease subunit S [Lentilactobacillus buchneri]|uniref:restriction endonuclease subunit S n=1 Tax=Lentilactobacillus buchneri TaxID=1581 RepID=UPI0021A6B14F|nr:restriction endonuclease subunit S [Lentilactobacillus buchneri]MCT3543584.1 restriction endonuclease subunit S [Lentilactobacillus buchneri]